MSDSYTFKYSGKLDPKLSQQDLSVIEYLLKVDSKRPELFPSHSFFFSNDIYKLNTSNYNLISDLFIYDFYEEKGSCNSVINYTIELCIPGSKLEQVYDDFLPMLTWLATKSLSSGYVGSFYLDGKEDVHPMLLFIHEKEIYFGGEESAHSFISGEEIVPKALFK